MKAMRLLLVIPLLVFGSMAAQAQEPPTLDRVEELARLGRTEEARDALRAWWSEAGPKASRRDTQRGLWLRGRLTPDPAEAALDFQRLVVEYPGGPFSVLALLRLAQAAYAAGDSATAAETVARLSLEYPASPVRREAEAWLATAGPVPRRAAGAEP
ncbi:MAG: tetratricopeptide repeat protein, partial [Longimicrobiales bacterium]|nr:tetratricopeptide repeat protein [Longimicrobiales bacterium]